MRNMFLKCSNLLFLDLSNFKTSKVLRMLEKFSEWESLQFLDISKFERVKKYIFQTKL